MYMWPLTFFYVPLPEELTNFQNNYRRQAGEVINVSIEICFASFFFMGCVSQWQKLKIENSHSVTWAQMDILANHKCTLAQPRESLGPF